MFRQSVTSVSLDIVKLTEYNPVQLLQRQDWACFEENSRTQTSLELFCP